MDEILKNMLCLPYEDFNELKNVQCGKIMHIMSYNNI